MQNLRAGVYITEEIKDFSVPILYELCRNTEDNISEASPFLLVSW
jgi:hypothetical protein